MRRIRMNRVRQMSDSMKDGQKEVCWLRDESTWGHTAGSGAIGMAPGGSLRGSQASIESSPVVSGAWREGEADGTPLWVQPRYHKSMGEGLRLCRL